MNERGTDTLDLYELDVIRTSRVRGAVLCETRQGLKLLKECRISLKRIEFEDKILAELEKSGSLFVDSYIRTKDNELIAVNCEGTRYTLRNWYDGRECNVKEAAEILTAVRELAKFHKLGRGQNVLRLLNDKCGTSKNLLMSYNRHNRELKRARNYIHNKGKKTEFEICVIESFDKFYENAREATCLLGEWNIQLPRYLCHGDFNQHHILINKEETAIVDFARMGAGIQLEDLYLFMRKVMEKHNWNISLGSSILETYSGILPFTEEEKRYLYILFLYPEKYWKQINFYFNASKAWIPARNVEKLTILDEQFDEREKFLKKFF